MPPERGRANKALVELLAVTLEVSVSSLRIVAGRSGRVKVVEVADLETVEVERRLMRSLGS